MTLGEFQQAIEEWLPPATAWKGDNVGTQIGRRGTRITNILVALDVTMDVIAEARARKANLIVTHHPLFFQPLRALTPGTRSGEIALKLAEKRIALYAAHTNLDQVRGGVSYVLASRLGLTNVRALLPLTESLLKVAVFVPEGHLENVAHAMHAAGGGTYLNYEECSFRTPGTGTFKGLEGAQPFIGAPGILEKTLETKLEMLVEKWKLDRVIAAMLRAHPYEEVAYDVFALENENTAYGLGAIGDLPRPAALSDVLRLVRRRLKTPVLRYTGSLSRVVKRIAVCGGAGSELIPEALRQGADVFVTADVKYHTFQDAERDLCLIDAGHHETEQLVLPLLAARVEAIVKEKKARSRVFVTTINSNPVSYF